MVPTCYFYCYQLFVKLDGVLIVLSKSATVESSGKWVASRSDRAVYPSVSCRQEVCRNTDDLLQLINACGHVSDRALKVVKNLVHYIARHSVVFICFMWGYNICVLLWNIHNFSPYCTFVCLLCQTLRVVNHYLSVCATCVHMLKPTHGEQRDFFTDEM